MNIYGQLVVDYGKDFMKNVRNLEKISRKLARFRNHLRFNLRCNSADLIPPSLKLRRPTNTKTCSDIVRKAEKALLNERIRLTARTVEELDAARLEKRVWIRSRNIDDSAKRSVLAADAHAYEQEFAICKQRQLAKFENLRNKPWNKDKNTKISDDLVDKWVINKSDKVLSPDHKQVLAKGLNFAVSPSHVPVEDIVVSTESLIRNTNLSPEVVDNIRAGVAGVLKSSNPPPSNLSKDERSALKELQKDKSITILPADKGNCVVVMDTDKYIEQTKSMLSDPKTYKKVNKVPNIKNELIKKLKHLKSKGAIDQATYDKCYPTVDALPRFYGLPKIHKPGTPLRPIVSCCGTTVHPTARHLADILTPLMGKSIHHVKNSVSFAKSLADLELDDDEIMVSYDVSSLFTAVPVNDAIQIINDRLQNDNTLADRTNLDVDDITDLLEFCLSNTYFMYQGETYQQTHGAAMGSPASPIVANLYMEHFEQKAISSAPHPPRVWSRYVDDTWTVQKRDHQEEFFVHINNQDPNIKFTRELEENRQLAFLDANTIRQEDGKIHIEVYRKPTHTDQYLNFHSHHSVEHKLSVVRTLFHRCNSIVTTNEAKSAEKKRISTALKNCNFPSWSLKDKPVIPQDENTSELTQDTTQKEKAKGMVVLPYCQGTSEKLRRIFRKSDIQAVFKPHMNLRRMLFHPKDKVDKLKKCGCVYEVNCLNCPSKYIGQTGRMLATRINEHKTAVRKGSTSSGISEHTNKTGHMIDWDNISVKDTESRDTSRLIREAIHIRRHRPSMNRAGGYELPHIYDSLLQVPTTQHPVV